MKKIAFLAIALMAAGSLWAQDLTAVYNDAAKAYQAKDFAAAAAGFEQVIDQGMDQEDAANIVATAKAMLPKSFFMLGGRAFKAGNYDEALAAFSRSAELAELYGDEPQTAKAKGWVANVYLQQGGTAFNEKDYATAVTYFAKGYEADRRNTEMALNLAMSYCEMGQYDKGMEVYEDIASLTNPKYAEAAAKAREMMNVYTINEVARLQAAGDNDAVLVMAEAMIEKHPENPLAHKVRIQAYAAKQDYAKVIELAPAAAEMQPEADDSSTLYYMLGLAYNAREMKPQAIDALRKVTAGPSVEAARQALADLTK